MVCDPWCMIYCWIWFVNILWRIFASVHQGCWPVIFFFLWLPCLVFSIREILSLWTVFERIPPLLFLGRVWEDLVLVLLGMFGKVNLCSCLVLGFHSLRGFWLWFLIMILARDQSVQILCVTQRNRKCELLMLTGASLVAQWYKICQPMQEIWVQSLGQEGPLEKEMATHCSVLAWEIPCTEEPSRLQSMELQRVRHELTTKQQQAFK